MSDSPVDNELLAFLQQKLHVIEIDIAVAKLMVLRLLNKSDQNAVSPTRVGTNEMQDIITLLKDTDPDDMPTFLAIVHKLCDVTSLLKNIVSMKMNSRPPRANHQQFILLLEFMESNGDLSRTQSGLQDQLRNIQQWQELSQLLNAVDGGIVRPADKWKRVWSDWKTKTKKKALIIQQDLQGAGGGPNRLKPLKPLNHYEKRLMRIIGQRSTVRNRAFGAAGPNVPIQGPVDEQLQSSIPLPPCPVPIFAPAPHAEPLPGPSNRPVQEVISPPSTSWALAQPIRIASRNIQHTPNHGSTNVIMVVKENRVPPKKAEDTRPHQQNTVKDTRPQSSKENERELEPDLLQLGRDRCDLEAQRFRLEGLRARIDADRLEVDRALLAVGRELTAQVAVVVSVLKHINNVLIPKSS